MKNFILLFVLQAVFAYSDKKGYRFLVLNDLHYNPNLTTKCDIGYCTTKGVYGQDSPMELIELVLDNAKETVVDEKIDGILISGDYICHDYEPGHNEVTVAAKLETITNMFSNIT